ncbi:MAG TPA: hypothetical protein VEO56_16195, partial [Bacteroidota bacterium]|nr:hypothetical protein [Bacteroidota bacterium]
MTTYAKCSLLVELILISGVAGKALASPPEKGHTEAFTFGNARIEFFSPVTVRLQYSSGGHFVDPPTVVVEPQARAE